MAAALGQSASSGFVHGVAENLIAERRHVNLTSHVYFKRSSKGHGSTVVALSDKKGVQKTTSGGVGQEQSIRLRGDQPERLRTNALQRSSDFSLPQVTSVMEDASGASSPSLQYLRESLNSALEASLNLDHDGIGSSGTQYLDAVELEEVAQTDELWLAVRAEARKDSEGEPALASFLYSTILAHRSMERALAFHLGNKLGSSTLLSTHLFALISDSFMADKKLREALRADMRAVKDRDPACVSYSHCLLNFKGYLACQAHRVAHRLWKQGRRALALALQSRVSEVFHVDIHPAAKIGHGVLFDHATGLVIGETAEIGNNVSILHHVTLGGTGAHGGDRHPKVGDGVLIGAGATLLGPILVGEGAKIGACSVVLADIPAHTTAVGNPARLVGGPAHPAQLKDIPSETMDHTSFMAHWSDYII